MSERRHHDEADAPGTGVIRDCRAADPLQVLDDHTARGTAGIEALTSSRSCRAMGSGDARPPVMRPGAAVAASLPSRTGKLLRWPDGRVTKVDA